MKKSVIKDGKKNYIIDEKRDLAILKKSNILLNKKLNSSDKIIVKLIKTQLESNCRKYLIIYLNKLYKKYKL